MKIKFIYQQFLSHISIIIVAFLILSIIFGKYTESFVYNSKADELKEYGENIFYELYYSPEGTAEVLSRYNKVLSGRYIQYRIFNEEGSLQYPRNGSISLKVEEWEKMKSGETVVIRQDFKRFENQGMTIVLMPFFMGGEFSGGIMLASPISGASEMIAEINKYLLYTLGFTLIVVIILSFLLSKIHVSRIKKIQKATSIVAEGDYSVRIPSSKFDEIGELAEDFNTMVNKINESMEEINLLENRRRQFMADVSHELRTPLTTISGVIEGLKNNMIPEEDRDKGISLVSKEVKRLIRLVNENLDYERIRSNQITLKKVPIQASDVLEIIQDQLEPLAEEKNNQIKIDAEKGLYIFADYDRLTQIIINLTKNSIQFTNDGTIWLRAKAGYKEMILEVEDTGIGIDPGEIEDIWHRFYKADISRTTNPYGEFGLGLSIVKQLVTLHDGTIEVSSEKGKGTIFTIRLPEHSKSR